jgi:hypothetical protein
VDGLDYRFCHPGCDVHAQEGCGGDACWLVYSLQDGVVGECADQRGGVRTHGEACRYWEGDPYWGDCTAAHICGSEEQGEPLACMGLCDRNDQSACTGGSACVVGFYDRSFGLRHLGLCVGDCDPLAEEGCADGEYCDMRWPGIDAEGEPRAVGRCVPGSLERDTGEVCVLDPVTEAHDCRRGHICGQLEVGADNLCLRLCTPGEGACAEDETCSAGRFAIWQGHPSPHIGVCTPLAADVPVP